MVTIFKEEIIQPNILGWKEEMNETLPAKNK